MDVAWLCIFTDATNVISCLIGFVFSCYYESKFSCSLVWLERYNRSFSWALTLSINTRVADRVAIEPDRGVKSEVGVLEVGSWTWEVGSWKSEVGNRKSKVGSRKPGQKWEVGGQKSKHEALSLNGQKWEMRSSNFVKPEVWSLEYEVWSLKSEVWSLKSEVGRPSSAFLVQVFIMLSIRCLQLRLSFTVFKL